MNRGALTLRDKHPERGGQARVMHALQERGFKLERPQVSRIFAGKQLPDPPMRAVIEDLWGVGWRLWDEEVTGESGEHRAVDADDDADDPTGTGDT
jgi:hypothetical protein